MHSGDPPNDHDSDRYPTRGVYARHCHIESQGCAEPPTVRERMTGYVVANTRTRTLTHALTRTTTRADGDDGDGCGGDGDGCGGWW